MAYKFFGKWEVDITTFTWMHEGQFSAIRDLQLVSVSHVGRWVSVRGRRAIHDLWPQIFTAIQRAIWMIGPKQDQKIV